MLNKTITLSTAVVAGTLMAGTVFAAEVKLPETVSWTAYNVGSTGYSHSVAIGKTLQDAYGVTLRVVPAKMMCRVSFR